MGDLEVALANAPAVTSLHVDLNEDALDERVAAFTNLVELQLREVPPGLVLPQALLELPLRHLGMTGKDDRLVVPELVRRLRIERLDVWDVRADELPPLPSVRHLEIVVADPKREVAILAERFNHLEHLEVWASHLPAGELPDDIERFSRLHTLRLISCGVSALPEAIAKLRTLRVFGIRGCPMHQMPEALTRMPELAVLELGTELTGLPPSLAAMTGLRELHMGHALNKGAMVSRYDDTSKLEPLPRVLGELAGLEKLNLDCCGVVDVTALGTLGRLRALSLEWSGITDVAPLGALAALEQLSLASCDRIRDLGPLAKLTKLRVLNLDNTRPASLDVLRELSSLRELHIESIEAKRIDAVYDLELDLHADDEVKERYAARAALRKLPSPAELAARLGERDVSVVQAALDQLVAWAAASSTRSENAIAALGIPPQIEGEDDDGSMQASGYLPALDLALDRYLAQLSPVVLACLFGALFQDTGDDFSAATRVASELVSRSGAGIDTAQLALVDAFIKACEHYDAGHREHSHCVFDTLLDHVFPQLGGPALAKLLVWATSDHLDDHGDGMQRLFAPAFARSQGNDLVSIVGRFETYLERCAKNRVEAVPGLMKLVDTAPANARDALRAMRARLEGKLAAARAREDLAKRLGSPDTVQAALDELADHSKAQLDELSSGLWKATNLEELPLAAARRLLRLWHRAGNANATSRLLANVAAKHPPDALRDDLDGLDLDANAKGTLLRATILRALETPSYPAAALEGLRAFATDYDHLPRVVADSAEVRSLLFGGAKAWDQERFEAGIAALAQVDRFESVSDADEADDDDEAGTASDLASMVANLCASHEFDVLHRFTRQFAKLGITGMPLQRILAQLIAACMVGGDEEGLQYVTPLVPETIEWDVLAYNLACKAGRDGDRGGTLRFTKRALELGKSPDQFLDDSDFESLHDDREFIALLDSHR